MILKGKYGLTSSVLSIVGLLLFYASSFGENGALGIYFFLGVAAWITSVTLGIVGVKSKENGFLKFFGLSIISIIILGYGGIIVLMGMRGFGA
ncbi:hypothetical protein [Sporosarcina limicola]|uniref:Uncharacterized protein n=1 Tax=Sporosarcina limicola TaxID=34101 RepID=A0A927RH02_9BACL|nr:hypothetical protein [Sporosarcina limicola]MBE1556982.1 hypothetical protein [Sporosarcina limicola]